MADALAPLTRTADTTVRVSDRASYDRAAAHAILDEALIAHVGFVVDDRPFVIPMVFGRGGDTLYLHGSVATRLARSLETGVPVCITVTHVDALVLAKSQFRHSMNYRSLVIMGRATRVRDADAEQALALIVDHALPGRSTQARPANRTELRQTMVLAVPIEEASVKVRAHGPVDEPDDLALEVWSGLVPVRVTTGEPEPDQHTDPGTAIPPAVRSHG